MVDGTRNDIQLLFTRQLHKVHGIAGHADGQLRIFLRMFHRIHQQILVEHIDVEMLATVRSEITIQQADQIAYLNVTFLT